MRDRAPFDRPPGLCRLSEVLEQTFTQMSTDASALFILLYYFWVFAFFVFEGPTQTKLAAAEKQLWIIDLILTDTLAARLLKSPECMRHDCLEYFLSVWCQRFKQGRGGVWGVGRQEGQRETKAKWKVCKAVLHEFISRSPACQRDLVWTHYAGNKVTASGLATGSGLRSCLAARLC